MHLTDFQGSARFFAVAARFGIQPEFESEIGVADSDPDGDLLTYSIISSPAHGTLGGTASNLVYTSTADCYGPDVFFAVSDGLVISKPATMTITVLPMNDTPLAYPQAVTTTPPDAYPFGKSADGIAVAEVAIALLSIVTLLPALLVGLSEGWITVDASGMRWKIRGKKGEIRWDRPFVIRRWQSVMTVTVYGDSGPSGKHGFPLIVYEVSQGRHAPHILSRRWLR